MSGSSTTSPALQMSRSVRSCPPAHSLCRTGAAADAASWFKTVATITLSKFRWSRHVYATYAEATSITDFLISPQHGIEEKFMAVYISKAGSDPKCAVRDSFVALSSQN